MKRQIVFTALLLCFCAWLNAQVFNPEQLYNLNNGVQSRSISFENPEGSRGQGGKAASHLGTGRKGFPARQIKPGETVVLCDIKGPGTIRHIWMTGDFRNNTNLRAAVIRAYWEEQKHPSIECPLGDFMGLAHSKVISYQSAVHSIGQNAALNFWLPMPFLTHGKLTLTNDGQKPFTLFYQVDYTINDKHDADVGRLHTCFLRSNPTKMKQDFELMPKRTGKGTFVGAVMGVHTLYPDWWGEGEVKFYMDGDTEFPTICGTGSEDYVCLSYGMQQTPFMNHGCNLLFTADSVVKVDNMHVPGEKRDLKSQYISMYRWHLPDPVYWQKECRVTIQQIGYSGSVKNNLYERQDDWSTATFWYEPVPSSPLPPFPSLDQRIADLDEVLKR